MKILLTNLTLASRTGTEIVTRDVALGLAAAGHTPIVFSPDPGAIANEIRDGGVAVVDDLQELSDIPDVIHGHHIAETTAAMLRFPGTPAIFVCHDRFSWHDLPPASEQIRRYVAVDRNCLERLTQEGRISLEKTRLIHNAVDIARFREPHVPAEQPGRALIFSNYAARGTHMEPVIEACSMLGLPVDVVGSGVAASSESPEGLLPRYDIVFAKARCALEAMAAGAAVVLCDTTGLGPMVTMVQVGMLRDWNFGRRCLQQRLTPGAIASEVMKYNPADARAVTGWVREVASLDKAIAAYVALYTEVIEEAHRTPVHVTLRGILRKTAENVSAFEERLRSAEVRGTTPLPPACIPYINVRAAEQIRSVGTGAIINVLTQIENASNETLASTEPYPVQLAYHWIDPVSQEFVVQGGHRTPLTREVLPHNLHCQPVMVEAPQRAGRYLLRLTMVQEFVCWFETVDPATASDLQIEVRRADESNGLAAGAATVDLECAIRYTHGVTLVRNGDFSNTGFMGVALPRMLTFAESRRFAQELHGSQQVTCVLTTPDLAAAIPAHMGLAVCNSPRTRFAEIHNHLAQMTSFYWKDFPTTIDPSARIHPSAQVSPFNVAVGARSVIEANAVIGERVIIGEGCVIQSGVLLGADGFQTDRSGEKYVDMVHAGGIRLQAGAKVFAGAIIARGVFREFTQIGRQARIGNRVFLSHNVHVGACAFVGHGAVVNGNVAIGDRAWIGPGANIANSLSIGKRAHVGLGSTVIRDVAPDGRVLGAIAVKSDRMLRFSSRLEKD
jgi:UDP-3-O-[3-hydroxymyristoyl] glucosamine N-acyltransferase